MHRLALATSLFDIFFIARFLWESLPDIVVDW